MREGVLSRNDEERDSRIVRLCEELDHPENQPFLTKNEPIFCAICQLTTKHVRLENLKEFLKHVFNIHGDESADLVIWTQEMILKEVLLQKQIEASEHGVYSN